VASEALGLPGLSFALMPALAQCAVADVVIDFTLPAALQSHLDACVALKRPLVIGTTGLTAEHQQAIDAAARSIPVLGAPNMSVGVTLLQQLVEQAARTLGASYDVEVLEMHHRHKVDAPSGTALALGEAAARGLDRNLYEHAVYGREGAEGPRDANTIGFATLRGGDVIGEHTVFLAGSGERLELGHRATSRETFAFGAIRAAQWLQTQPVGRYDMKDALGLKPSA
jgi:4-hydroxy-tetrahydrodipicolinate reductase